MTFPTISPDQAVLVGMGQIALGRDDMQLKSVLGSCVGVALLHPRSRVAALAHVVLPESAGRDGAPGKFADLAVPRMLHLLQEAGAPPRGWRAKLAGGANMFDVTGPLQIGDQNIAAVRRLLAERGIPIAGEHLGGRMGRRISLECRQGALLVDIAGATECVL